MFGFGTTELIIVLVIVILLFGVGRIGKIAGELGSGIKNFRSSMNDAVKTTENTEEKTNQINKGN
jgi:sec-independent protein translocase protein TatA